MSFLPIISFNSPDATLETVGGKGLNLIRLTRAGFTVPGGFIIPTDAYRASLSTYGLQNTIEVSIRDLLAEDAPGLERASEEIRRAFSTVPMPDELAEAIRAAYESLKDAPVAVRSSATAEDLPDLSFAGQQDTYLNILGISQLLKAVVDCWSSLWTARGIGYRIRNKVSQSDAALAVVVQEMIQSESSGVLFTANPLTGLRSEVVIDATLGLGEALVSGQVEPDHYVVNVASGKIIQKTLGAKKISTRAKADGGVQTMSEDASEIQALSDSEIIQLGTIATQVQKEYQSPQDIEWAFAKGRLYLLQTRAITSLFPIPHESFDPLEVWFSFGAVQGMLGPITPLGQDTVRLVGAGAGGIFGLKLRYDKLAVFGLAGERIWIKVDGVMQNPLGARIFSAVVPMFDPSIGQILIALAAEPQFKARKGILKFSTLGRLILFGLRMLPHIIYTMLYPEGAREETMRKLEHFLSQAGFSHEGDRFARLADCVSFLRDRTVSKSIETIMPQILPLLGPSLISLSLLTKLAAQTDAGDHGIAPMVLELTRGLPNNVTTEMDLALWEAAKAIHSDADSWNYFKSTAPSSLAADYLNGALGGAAQSAIAAFMDRYGMRGVGEIDLGSPRWREQPEPIMQTLQSYLQISDESYAPDVVFRRGAQAAEDAIEKLATSARQQRGGWLRERLVRGAARRLRILMGVRESPKYYVIRVMGLARQELLSVGHEFETARMIERADDLFFLYISELEMLSKNESRDWKALIARRRAGYERELRRKQVPRVLVSDGRAFYEGLGSGAHTEDVMTGSPVSPGVAEGVVHVIFDPRSEQLAPGEILVCPGTDPAWTPLFMSAGGLITEVGGMMTHGSVVAREYGIPAVVGVHQATSRLTNGQRIRLDGTTGKILVLTK
jgi:rifampicin phosphotransferase